MDGLIDGRKEVELSRPKSSRPREGCIPPLIFELKAYAP